MKEKSYWWETESYSFIKLPKLLLESPKYATLSSEAKILYSLLLDRMKLSTRSGWQDKNGYVYIYFTQDEVCKVFHCGHDKAGKIFAELERANLILRRRQGLGRPHRIYVYSQDIEKPEVQTSENPNSGQRETRLPDSDISDAINTDDNNTEFIKNNLSISGYDAMDTEQRIKKQIEYDVLFEQCDEYLLNCIVTLMVDTICGNAPTVRISGNDIPRKDVRSRLFSLDSGHIEYVIDSLHDNKTEVRNPKSYMLAALYNAPASMDYYYTAKVSSDRYGC